MALFFHHSARTVSTLLCSSKDTTMSPSGLLADTPLASGPPPPRGVCRLAGMGPFLLQHLGRVKGQRHEPPHGGRDRPLPAPNLVALQKHAHRWHHARRVVERYGFPVTAHALGHVRAKRIVVDCKPAAVLTSLDGASSLVTIACKSSMAPASTSPRFFASRTTEEIPSSARRLQL